MAKKKVTPRSDRRVNKRLAAFIDMVGVRDLAKSDPLSLKKTLESFREAIGECLDSLHGNSDQVYFFSDCAFVRFSSGKRGIQSAEKFIHRLREELLPKGLYFKASVCLGDLGAVPADSWPGLAEEMVVERQKRISGFFFGATAADLYGLQEKLKGIGVWIDETLGSDDSMSFVWSAFLPSNTGKHAVSFRDLKWDRRCRTIANYEAIKESILITRTRSISSAADRGKLARYYVTPLVSWAQSIDLSKGVVTERDMEDNDTLRKIDPLTAAILNGELKQLFRGLKGYELIFFAWARQVYLQQNAMESNVFRIFASLVSKQESLLDGLSYVPKEIFAESDRKYFTQSIAKKMQKGQRR